VSDEDLLNHQRVALLLVTSLDPRFAIIDLSAADPFDVTADRVRALAKLPPAMPKGTILASLSCPLITRSGWREFLK
jgi:hypothetical protein